MYNTQKQCKSFIHSVILSQTFTWHKSETRSKIHMEVTHPNTIKFSPQTFSYPILTKLDETNFLTWKHQVITTVRGYELEEFLKGTEAVPPKYELEDNGLDGNIHKEYLQWLKQDQLLLSWLLSLMGESMVSRMVGSNHSYQAWEKLETYYALQTKVKEQQLHTQVKNLKKGGSSINDFLLKIKKIVDSLGSIRYPLQQSDHIDTILDGLPSEYDSFITTITSVSSILSSFAMGELESLLLAQEDRIEHNNKEVEAVVASFA